MGRFFWGTLYQHTNILSITTKWKWDTVVQVSHWPRLLPKPGFEILDKITFFKRTLSLFQNHVYIFKNNWFKERFSLSHNAASGLRKRRRMSGPTVLWGQHCKDGRTGLLWFCRVFILRIKTKKNYIWIILEMIGDANCCTTTSQRVVGDTQIHPPAWRIASMGKLTLMKPN